ncbi:MAG TPA: FAD-dependent monooxygenase [Ktedonobacteraceae bacterium]|nr:FAD-dependent monooxygenase [Ktedonobacteraceae bacterium]
MNPQVESVQNTKALIIGGGIAGLLAARVLCEFYGEVLILERDSQPEQAGARPGSPQSFHLHQVLPRGDMILEELFPGFIDDLLDQGAFATQNSMVQWSNRYGTMTMPQSEKSASYSRGLLEWVLRQRVRALSNVRFLYQQEVMDLEISADRARITGVHVRQRGQVEQRELLAADLVVEASGRASRLPQWLQALGFQLPEDERLVSSIGYSTRYYKIPTDKKGCPAINVVDSNPAAGNSASGVVRAIENGIWATCLSTIGGNEYPSIDADEYEAGFTRLGNPRLAELLRGAEPLGDPRGFRIPQCIRHHYEQMEQWPAGLLVLGDAFCYFDPVYGQGMTVAAIEVEALARCLREQREQFLPGFERRVLQQMQEAIYPAWWLSALEDLRWPGVTHSGGEPFKGVRVLHRYFDLALKRMTDQFENPQAGFNPQLLNYMLMTALLIAPRDVINITMLRVLLDNQTHVEQQALLGDMFQGYSQSIEAVLNEIAPASSSALIGQAVQENASEVRL